ncbi:MAG TPA: efflux transporter outer membrane subunit [Candidatus Didemnitutus sp.]|nr:efflux transporter outer membrane subunit [Candidatus Didemnitutus sp.]
MNDPKRIPGWAMVAALLGGCAVGPNYQRPAVELPTDWNAAAPTAAAPLVGPARWWQNFGDPELTALVEGGLRNNLDVQVAEASLRQARAARGAAAGGFWPSITASGAALRGRSSGSATTGNSFQAGLDAVWELDFFGGVRRTVESADASAAAAQANLGDVQVTLAAEVALDYLQVRSAQEQIVIARENLAAEQHTAGLIRQRLKVGFSSALDAANADAQVATTASTIPPLETSLRQAIHALGVLLGRPPSALVGELAQSGAVPVAPPGVPAGLPSDLLRRRPDIRAAEARLHAATAQIGVAVADFFPRFPLTAAVGYQSSVLRTLFATGSRTWSAGPTLTWPILQGGSTAANVRVQEALRDQAYLTYRKTILVALEEVEDALVAGGNEEEHRQALAQAVAQNQRAFDLSTRLYTQGAADFLTVLDAERSLYSSQTALAQSRLAGSADLIALYKALGGGWNGGRE